MNYRALKTELAAGHPVTGAYDAVDATAASEINAVNIDVDGPIEEMVKYLCTHDNRSNEGGDTDATLIMGRLEAVANSQPYTDVFRRAGVWEAGGSGANEQIALSATGNTITFGTAHTITSLGNKDSITLSGSSADDGTQKITDVTGQVVTVESITVTETFERVFRIFKNQDAKLLTREQIQNARAILALLRAPSLASVDFTNTEIGLAFADMEAAEVWKSTDTTALVNFSNNVTSRAIQLGLGVVQAHHVTTARE